MGKTVIKKLEVDGMSYEFWVVVEKSEIPGIFSAHALDFGVVTQGNSLEHAEEMIMEATRMTLEDDAEKGLDPHARQSPEKFYRSLPN